MTTDHAPPDLATLASNTAALVRHDLLPLDLMLFGARDLLRAAPRRGYLNHLAWRAGVFAPHAPLVHGGRGLTMLELLPILVEAGASRFGPTALGLVEPDVGNVLLLRAEATTGQSSRHLAPLASGEITSALLGADDSDVRATRVDGGWELAGRCSATDGERQADLLVLCAVPDGSSDLADDSATLFLTPRRAPGVISGSLDSDRDTLDLEAVFISESEVLGGIGTARRALRRRAVQAHTVRVGLLLGAATHLCRVSAGTEVAASSLAAPRSTLQRACAFIDDGQDAAALVEEAAVATSRVVSTLLTHARSRSEDDLAPVVRAAIEAVRAAASRTTTPRPSPHLEA